MLSGVTLRPSSWRSRFSRRIFSENGRRATSRPTSPARLASRYTASDRPPTANAPRAPKLFLDVAIACLSRVWPSVAPVSAAVGPAPCPSLWEPPAEDNLGPTCPTPPRPRSGAQPVPQHPLRLPAPRRHRLDCAPVGLGGGQAGPRRPALHRPTRPGRARRRPARARATPFLRGDHSSRMVQLVSHPGHARLRDALPTAPGERGRRDRQGGGPAGRHRQPQAGHRRGRGRRGRPRGPVDGRSAALPGRARQRRRARRPGSPIATWTCAGGR